MEEDRAGLGVGLRGGKRTVGEHQIGLARRDMAQAVAAGRAAAIGDTPFGQEAIVVGGARLEFADAFGRQGDAADGHGLSSRFVPRG